MEVCPYRRVIIPRLAQAFGWLNFVTLSLISLFFACNSTCLAETNLPVSPTLPPPTLENLPKVHSSDRRQLLTYEIGGEVGSSVFPIPSYGIHLGEYLSTQNLLEFEFTQGELSWWFIHVRSLTLGLHLQHFIGNSFYLSAGADDRKLTLEDPSVAVMAAIPQTIGQAESLNLALGLGNQWQWQHWSVGCEWMSLMIPVWTFQSDYNTSGYTGFHQSELDAMWNRVAKFWTLGIFRVSTAYSF